VSRKCGWRDHQGVVLEVLAVFMFSTTVDFSTG